LTDAKVSDAVTNAVQKAEKISANVKTSINKTFSVAPESRQ